ncbi:MAG: hypothetical protein HY722_10340 [Planctomycetes bacterium]|nr:hypothetical protein [Planctomycetota bacterium]
MKAALRIKRLQDELVRINRSLVEAQAQLVQSGKLAAIGELSAGLAHEINNPIAIVYGHTQLALRRLDREPLDEGFRGRYEKFLRTLEQESRRCKSIIENLLRFARPDTSRGSPLELERVVEGALDFFLHQLRLQGVEVAREYGRDLPRVMGNETQLGQVFVNIIMNARQVMPSGGTLTLRTWREEGRVCASVADTGKGIPAENMDRIFDPFFTTKEEWQGTGLGLSVSHRIVRDHGGEIRVASELNRGATFTVVLPVDAQVGARPEVAGER